MTVPAWHGSNTNHCFRHQGPSAWWWHWNVFAWEPSRALLCPCQAQSGVCRLCMASHVQKQFLALGRDVLEFGMCHLIPSSAFYLLEDRIFHLKKPAKAICSIGLADSWYKAAVLECSTAEASAQISSPPLLPIVFLILYQSTYFFCSCFLPFPTHFCDTLISICVASWDHKTTQAGRDLRRSKAHPPAQSRINWEIRSSFSGLDPSGSQKSLMETAQPLWEPLCPTACLSTWRKRA